jgi:hypothetical protein
VREREMVLKMDVTRSEFRVDLSEIAYFSWIAALDFHVVFSIL